MTTRYLQNISKSLPLRGRLVGVVLCLPLTLCAQTKGLRAARQTVRQAVRQAAPAVAADTLAAEPKLSIAVFSYKKCWQAMPEVAQVDAEVAQLTSQYKEELQRVEADFKTKYEDFLEQQASLAPSIRNKRQAELQKILEENLAFKAKALQNIDSIKTSRLQPAEQKLQSAIETVAKEGAYSIVINTDNNACPFFDPALITDITEKIVKAFIIYK